MSNPWTIVAITVLLIAASAFFVAVEFSLIAARRHRLEDEAAHSASARAALRSSSELSLLLAGSQLGITVCTLALGAITKPAVDGWLTPLLAATGMPGWIADVGGFVLALLIVTFLHLVVGEMAPKSWAIAHPERSAILLALPMRAFMAVFRPLLLVLNEAANRCLRRVGVTPVNEVESGQDPAALRHLVEHSATVGALDEQHSGRLTSALELEALTVGDIAQWDVAPSSVPGSATPAQVREAADRTGHLRQLVTDGAGLGVVHVRDCLRADRTASAADLMRPVLILDADEPAYAALATMRESRAHLAVVERDGARAVLTLSDLLGRLMPV
ncbi:CNNM domain-containing protein [Tsukamurella ocularis]|uniref:CNNM domain-containing protein n=1 Tax=Tsukamurella ocularis TaxID=1970234 RepID=UPI0021673DA6|nr:CNNM domain-containing protein [Tsukamurella ocularis]MCS3779303.1 CBS domain containing-hemolysin-like protein [Tsukamurella ocularis]MCS3787077.1 CBS domain containing-hemolysin-like protein [Tsukamurella ocularis]MCS3852468.1 CBS domain containing-hemolysin-like protein [Tsukamurella ocularis]